MICGGNSGSEYIPHTHICIGFIKQMPEEIAYKKTY
jgi:hypothetical protein